MMRAEWPDRADTRAVTLSSQFVCKNLYREFSFGPSHLAVYVDSVPPFVGLNRRS
jgi:hypothetical protein